MASMHDPTRGLHIFVVTAETASFSEAADRLGITRSAVGKAIARLEERLNVRLFNRSTRNHGLTDEGRHLLARSSQLLDQLRITEAELTGRAVEPAGELRIDLPELLRRKRIVPILLKVADRFPALRFVITFNNRHVELIEEGYDLTVRIGDLGDSLTLASRHLGFQETLLCASPAYLETRGVPVSWKDLASHTLLPEFRNGRARPWTLTDPEGQTRRVPAESRLQLEDIAAISVAARSGAGIGLVPRWLVEQELQKDTLREVLPSYGTVRPQVSALWPHSRILASKQRVVIDALFVHLGMNA